MSTPLLSPVRLQDIAAAADVSITAVSMALANSPQISERTRQRVLEISRKLNYQKPALRRAARLARERRSWSFGFFLMGYRLDTSDASQLLHHMVSHAAREQIRLEMMSVEDTTNPAAVVEQAKNYARQLNGLLLYGYIQPYLLEALTAARIPHVVAGHVLAQPGQWLAGRGQAVCWDEQQMGWEATRRLIAAGHRRIGFACEELPVGMSYWRWLVGYQSAHQVAGIASDPSLIYTSWDWRRGAAEAMRRLVERARPATAYVIPSLDGAACFAAALRRAGHDLPPQNLVVWSSGNWATTAGLGDCAQVVTDPDLLAEVCLRQLQHLQQPMPCASELLLPFTTRNFAPEKPKQPDR